MFGVPADFTRVKGREQNRPLPPLFVPHESRVLSGRKTIDLYMYLVVSRPFSNRFSVRAAAQRSAVFRAGSILFYYDRLSVIGIARRDRNRRTVTVRRTI